jgi:hypothetical protein
MDPPVFVFALILSLLTGVGFGIIPALRVSRTSVSETLKEEARTAARSRSRITFVNAAIENRLVLSKAGMSNSSYQQPLPADVRPFAATGNNPAGMPVPGKYHTYPEMAAAGLWTTPADLAKFCIEIQRSREGRSTAILNKQSVTEMLTRQKGEWGLGFQLSLSPEAPRFLHGGADEGFRAELVCGFDGTGATVMANSDNGSAVAHEVIQSVANAYHWRRMEPKVRSTVPAT